MSSEAENLFKLLPALYRIRDAERGGPLEALCGVLAEQLALLREDLAQLYDDQFIETCAEWVAPYLGGLIGYSPIHGVTEQTISARAEVANTIAARRRKGTASVLEQLARDTTGWPAHVVEFFERLRCTQHMNHVRPRNHGTVDLRRWEPLERQGSAFDSLAHTLDVRAIERQGGRYGIPNVGLFLWRLELLSLTRSPAVRVDDQRFRFSPLGIDLQLYSLPEAVDADAGFSEACHVPEPLSRRVLDRDLAQHYGPKKSLLVEADGGVVDRVQICNLADSASGWAHLPTDAVSIDPVLGRLAFPSDRAPEEVRVTFHYAFSARAAGGEYERGASFTQPGPADVTVARGSGLRAALAAVGRGGLVEIADSGRYEEALALRARADAHIEVRAANQQRPIVVLEDALQVRLAAGAVVTLNGLLIAGGLSVTSHGGAGPRLLRLRHCTLVPGRALTAAGEPLAPDAPALLIDASETTVEIEDCIVGAIRAEPGAQVQIARSIVDATARTRTAFSARAAAAPGATLSLRESTVVGRVHTERLELASNSIITAARAAGDVTSQLVWSERLQQGCIRFCALPLDSLVPRPYHCQSDSLVAFTSLCYGTPGYGQLASYVPSEIRCGADDEGELGAFHDLYAPQREANLKLRLQEYLRFGLEAGVFFAS